MAKLISRALSLLLVLVYAIALILPVLSQGASAGQIAVIACERCALLLIPLALIWFPEPIGAATGFIGHGEVTAESPPFLVALMGWILLLGIPAASYWLIR